MRSWVRRFLSLYHCPNVLASTLNVGCFESEFHECKLSTVGSRFFSVFGPSAWKKLPLPLRQTPTLSTLKSDCKTSFLTTVGLSSLLFVFVCPRPCVDCWHRIVFVLRKCPRMTARECALNSLGQDSETFKLLLSVIVVRAVCDCGFTNWPKACRQSGVWLWLYQ